MYIYLQRKKKTKLRISAFVVKRNQKLAQVLVEPGPLNLQQDNNMYKTIFN